MLYTLTFTKRLEGMRIQMMDPNGNPATLQVEADSRTGAIYHDETATFCTENDCSVRRVLP